MDLGLQGKKVAVTGAAGGFGEVFVQDLLEHGATVYAISRTESKLNSLVSKHPSVIPIICDLTKWDDATKVLTEKLPDDLDALINNAGVCPVETLDTLTEDGVDQVLGTNLKGTLCATKVAVKKMIDSGKGGSIVNISSVAADFPCPFLLGYSMTKAGLNRLTNTLATQLGPHKIRVNCVNPTVIMNTSMGDTVFDTDEKLQIIKMFSPLAQQPTTNDVSNALLFLLSDKAKTITGQKIYVDSGIHGG